MTASLGSHVWNGADVWAVLELGSHLLELRSFSRVGHLSHPSTPVISHGMKLVSQPTRVISWSNPCNRKTRAGTDVHLWSSSPWRSAWPFWVSHTVDNIICVQSNAHELTLKIYPMQPSEFSTNLQIFFHHAGGPPAPSLMGLNAPMVVDRKSTVSCTIVFFSLANVTFTWTIQNQQLSSYYTEVIARKGNIATFSSVLQNNFTHGDDGMKLTCSIKAETGSDTYENSTNGTIHLYCTYESHIYIKIYESDTLNNPIYWQFWQDKVKYLQIHSFQCNNLIFIRCYVLGMHFVMGIFLSLAGHRADTYILTPYGY